MAGLKNEVQLALCVVISVLIFMPGGFTADTDACTSYNDTDTCCQSNCTYITCTAADASVGQFTGCINETAVDTVCSNATESRVNNCTEDIASCSDFDQNQTECCASTLGCNYITNCIGDDDTVVSVCLTDDDDTIKAKCTKDPGQKTCPAAVASCADFKGNETECCTSDLNCTYIVNCTSTEDVLSDECLADDDTTISSACPKSPGAKTCPKDQPTTTPSPTTSTTQAPADTCDNLSMTECCGDQGQQLKCDYVNCTGTPACLNETERAGCNATMCEGPGSTTSSTASSTTTTTTAASASTKDCSGQHFDGASFIGGIILCGGIIAIIFFGLKFYRSRQESNYHTL